MLLDTAYGALKKTSRSNVVIGGMTLNGGTLKLAPDFIDWMKLPNGRPPRMDLWGHNPFDARFPSSPTLRWAASAASTTSTPSTPKSSAYLAGHRKVPRLWLSEWTIVSDHPLQLFSGFYVSRASQAQRLKAAYKIARGDAVCGRTRLVHAS